MDDLKKRDYTLILDKSGSMSTMIQGLTRSRWDIAQESTLALARKCEQFDPDGITVYVFSNKFKRYDDVTSSKVDDIFLENDPSGSTDLASVLKDATENYFDRKNKGQSKEGETILVITDGEPDDKRKVFETIIAASQKMERDAELGITFIQVGNDSGAKKFLDAIDNDLQGVGAKFDICDTVTMDDLADRSLAEVLLAAVND
ncbi:VWA domain-containing protein [Chroococcidiopsis sp.]|uniref:VWA domain-containing protein n=1 Tax=Chroococcidiopsis sp. TaxID=3088168 RepID=UPI003F3548FF